MSNPSFTVYTTEASPPSIAVLATLTALDLPYNEVRLDFFGGEIFSVEHEKVYKFV
jgi:glutathione S-transferase